MQAAQNIPRLVKSVVTMATVIQLNTSVTAVQDGLVQHVTYLGALVKVYASIVASVILTMRLHSVRIVNKGGWDLIVTPLVHMEFRYYLEKVNSDVN